MANCVDPEQCALDQPCSRHVAQICLMCKLYNRIIVVVFDKRVCWSSTGWVSEWIGSWYCGAVEQAPSYQLGMGIG